MVIGMMIRRGLTRFSGFQCRKITSIRHFCGASARDRSSGIPSEVKQDVVAISKKKWNLFAEKVASFDIPNFKQMLVAPLIQVFSISIHAPFETESATEIYGFVEAIEEDQGNTTFTLYDRDPHHCESIILGPSNNNNNLSLIGPEVCALTCLTVTTLHLHLNDKRQGINVISSLLVLHSNNDKVFDSSCDKLIKAVVHGVNGFSAHVCYTTFKYGVFVHVRIGVVEKYDKTCDFVDIHGSVIARYGRTESDLENVKTTVFYKPPDQTIRAAVPTVTPIPLSRRIVAVPAYGILKLDVDIWESGVQFATGCLEFDNFGFSGFERFVIGDRGVVCVKVNWNKRVYETKGHYLDLEGHFVFHHYLRKYSHLIA